MAKNETQQQREAVICNHNFTLQKWPSFPKIHFVPLPEYTANLWVGYNILSSKCNSNSILMAPKNPHQVMN